jgi:hypothetical protein
LAFWLRDEPTEALSAECSKATFTDARVESEVQGRAGGSGAADGGALVFMEK